jgi:Anaphase-promoting complex subunit 11 RING-H2 finger
VVQVGSEIVWSSNEACDHHFHSHCIEKWLMKQREGPLCPICRRDFVVDPLDFLEEERNDNANSHDRVQLPVVLWDQAQHLSADDFNDFDGAVQRPLNNLVVASPVYLRSNSNYTTTNPSQLEDGIHSPSGSESNEAQQQQEQQQQGH